MDVPAQLTDDQQVSAADIARIAGVTRAAVSNWRRRHADFPDPVDQGAASPRFSLAEVQTWLDRQDKGGQQSPEVRLWHELRGAYPDSILRGVADAAEHLAGASPEQPPGEVVEALRTLSETESPQSIVAALVERLSGSPQRTDTDVTTTPRMVRAIQCFCDPSADSVFDPATGTGTLLLAVGALDARRTGQDVLPDAARLVRARARLASRGETEVRVGDSLLDDQWEGHTAALVICTPPAATTEWGRERLLMDGRWVLALPPKAESDLAWLQHAFAHTAPGGQTVVTMPTAAAHRRTGRRIRAELVRRGLLEEVVALPAGMAATHALPVHLWILRRPNGNSSATHVRMTDMTSADPDEPFSPEKYPRVEVPLIDLLDDMVDLSPTRHAAPDPDDVMAVFEEAGDRLTRTLAELGDALPALSPATGPLPSTHVRVADLIDGGLASLSGGRIEAADDGLDSDFLNGFLRSPANTRRSTSSSGTFRVDARAATVPRLDRSTQRAYGRAFKSVEQVERLAAELSRAAEQMCSAAREGLTSGHLAPSADGESGFGDGA
ncbi:N-6 DNA methylase [Nocardiopsis sp. YSL2]|uniref:N-6 DNA methylase n=1 Tax=Nocardiopsis sp. YSL2 TaxID=2939492 RepID=UPI0026F4425D|nr:N-6 DNA methylase [Nocardiopsis sp. YSL2]